MVPGRERSLTICHVDAERAFSGGEVQVFALMRGLRARGHRSILIAPPGSRAQAAARADDFESRAASMSNDLDLASAARLWRHFAELAPDVVHLHTSRAAWLGALALRFGGKGRARGDAASLKRPVVVVTRRMDREVRRNWRTRALYGRWTDAVVAISDSVARGLVEGGVDPSRLRVIRSSIDLARKPQRERALLREQLDAAPQDRVVLTLGALVPRKGIDVLLEALARLERTGRRPHVWIAGDGEARPALEAQARQADLRRVRFLGARSDADDLLAACDVFAMPSRREGLGVAALEAGAASRAVVASNVGGLAEVVEDQVSGLLVPVGDAAALAKALERLIDDDALRARLGSELRRRVEARHAAEAMVAAYEDLYRALIAGAPGSATHCR